MSNAITMQRRMAHHRIGTEVSATSAVDAMHQAGLDWTVHLDDIQTTTGLEIEDKFATVKTVINEDGVHRSVLGVVGKRYQVVQNAEIFSALDALVDSGDARYAAAGQLDGGRIVWMLMELPKEVSIAGDPHAAYLLARTSHDGTSSLQIAPTITRLRCTNQINNILRGDVKYTLRHSTGAKIRVQQLRDALGVVYANIDNYVDTATGLLSLKVDDRDVQTMIKKIFPLPAEIENTSFELLTTGEKNALSRANKARHRVANIYRNGTGTQEGLEGTAYGLWQAVIEYADHFTSGTEVKRAERILTNKSDAIKTKALATILTHA